MKDAFFFVSGFVVVACAATVGIALALWLM